MARALLSLLAPGRSRPRSIKLRLPVMKALACMARAASTRAGARRALEEAGLTEICLASLCDGAISEEGMAMREAAALALDALVEGGHGQELGLKHPGTIRVVLAASRDPDIGRAQHSFCAYRA